MDIKRGILVSLTLYLVTFIIGIILTVIAQINLSSPQSIPTTYWIITIVATVILTSLASLWYFNKGANRNAKEGFKLGITFVIVGFILDLLFFIPAFFTSEGGQIIIQYYSTASFYITLALVVATAVFIGSRAQQVKEEKTPAKKKRK